MFGVPMPIRSDAGEELAAKVFNTVVQVADSVTRHQAFDHPCSQGAVERMGWWLLEEDAELCRGWRGRWDGYV